jgi:cell division inhibitor SepF
MGFFDSLKKTVGIEDIEEEEEEVVVEEKKEELKPITPVEARERFEERTFNPSISNPVVSSNTNKYTSQMKMVVICPEDFNDSPKLVDSLKARKPVIINLENLETDVARRIFEFLSGATYALNGNVQKIANNIFVFAPENVDVSYNQTAKPAENAYKSPWK